MRRKRLIVAAAGALLAAVIAGGVAYATIPGSGNVYTACMLKGIGTIRQVLEHRSNVAPSSAARTSRAS